MSVFYFPAYNSIRPHNCSFFPVFILLFLKQVSALKILGKLFLFKFSLQVGGGGGGSQWVFPLLLISE